MFSFDNALYIIIAAVFINGYINRGEELMKLFKNKYWFINFLIIIFFSIYIIKFGAGKNQADRQRLKDSIRKGLLALIIGIFAHLHLTIAPFWIVFALSYYSEGFV